MNVEIEALENESDEWGTRKRAEEGLDKEKSGSACGALWVHLLWSHGLEV